MDATVFHVLWVGANPRGLASFAASADTGRSFDVRIVPTLEAGLEIISATRCDALVLELSAGEEGMGATATIRMADPDVAVILLGDDTSASERAIEAGAQEWLPVAHLSADALARAVRHAIGRQNYRRAAMHERDLLEALLDNLPDRVYFKDERSRFVRVSRALADFVGADDPSKLTGKTDFDIFSAEHAQPAYDDEQSLMQHGKPIIGKVEKETLPDGRVTWALTTKVPLKAPGGRVVGTFGVSRDITSLKRMETALAEERNLLRTVIDGLPDQVFVKDMGSRFVLVNEAVRRFFGNDVTGKTDHDLFPGDAAGSFREEELGILERGQPILDRESLVRDTAGRPSWLQTTKVPLRNTEGRVIGLIGVNRDVTARRQAEEEIRAANDALQRTLAKLRASHEQLKGMQLQLIEAEKMKSVGRLAAGVAHEVKNPLAIIGLGIGYVSRTVAKDDPNLASVTTQMREAIARAEQVIRGLLDFAAPRQLVLQPTDLITVIEQALLLVKHELAKSRVVIHRRFPADLQRLALDANKLEQVFVNAFTNAAHAMEGGGTLTIRIYPHDLAPGEYAAEGRPHPFAPNEKLLVVEIDDSGRGIPLAQLNRVFEPFFTTKGEGKGTGLGLSVARSIVELHGGWLELKNRPEGGARMTMVLKAG